jgi:putative transposase
MRGEEQSRLSLGSYGRPRMTEELKEIGLNVGHRRVGRLMRQNGISVIRYHRPAVVCLQTMRGAQTHPSRAFREYPAGRRVTIDSNRKFNIAPNLLDSDFSSGQPNKKWAGDITYIWTREGWLYLAVIH